VESNDHSTVEEETHSAGSYGSTYDEELEHPIDEELSDAANGEHWKDTAALARHFLKAAKPVTRRPIEQHVDR